MLHTHPACSGVWFFWKNIAAKVGKINQIQKGFPVLMYIAAFSHSEGKFAST